MKLFLVLMLLTTSAFSFDGTWKVESIKKFTTKVPKEIKKIATDYPEILGHGEIRVANIISISLEDVTYKYIGETICAEGDGRLQVNLVNWRLCEKGNSCSGAQSNASFDPRDPCDK